MVTSNGKLKINISEEERKGLIKNFKIGILRQLCKEGYFSSEQLRLMEEEIRKEAHMWIILKSSSDKTE